MGHRVNVMLDDEAWEILRSIERGERSRFVSAAVKRASLLRRRRRALEGIDSLRKGMTHPPGDAERWIREDRDTHRGC